MLQIYNSVFFKIRKVIAGEVTHLEQRDKKAIDYFKKCFK